MLESSEIVELQEVGDDFSIEDSIQEFDSFEDSVVVDNLSDNFDVNNTDIKEQELSDSDVTLIEDSGIEEAEFNEDINISNEIPQDEAMNVEEVTGTEIDNNDDFSQFTEFDYSTEITPSIDTVENASYSDSDLDTITEDLLEASDKIAENQEEQEPSVENDNVYNHLDSLYGKKEEKAVSTPGRRGLSILPILCLAIVGAIGYFGYTKFATQPKGVINSTENGINLEETANPKNKTIEDMPIESVEDVSVNKQTNEGVSVAIPAIEQNLDAAINVSNLLVNWEVPAGYTTNTTAKRYFMRLGKVLQLNLKTELLQISVSPISNKVSFELEFDKKINKFIIKRIVASSGSKKFDDVAQKTVKKVLDMNFNINMNVFSNIQGNPVLVIKL